MALQLLRIFRHSSARAFGVPRGAVFTGDLFAAGPGAVYGKLTGNVRINGSILIGKEAEITGIIEAATIVVLGKVTGDLFASKKILVKNGATVTGRLEAPVVTIAEEAVVETPAPATIAAPAEVSTPPPFQEEPPVITYADIRFTGIVSAAGRQENTQTWF